MPGAYTHLTIARLLTAGNALKNMKLPPEARTALMEHAMFCHLGAISPDYPYMHLGDSASEHWANAMHHKYGTLTADNILHVGIRYLRKITGDNRLKCLAWLLGYTSHVVADVTCHPVTNLLVGDYEAGNQKDHRVSEMHQDVYIFKTRTSGDVRKSEHIKNVVGLCCETGNDEKVDAQVEKMWRHMLSTTFPQLKGEFNLDIHGWHRAFQFWLEDIAEELAFIPSRHVRDFLAKEGVAYPRYNEIDHKAYIEKLRTPKGIKTYDQVFDLARRNVAKVWKMVSDAVFLGDETYKEKINIWNLDSGQVVRTPKVMWEGEV